MGILRSLSRPAISESKVLVVDDDGMVLTFLKRSLEQLGYSRITTVWSAEDALAKLANDRFDLIITDWYMPRLSGMDLLKYVRAHEHHKETPVLMLTGKFTRDSILEAIQAGATSYIVKPFSLDTLKKKIEVLAG
jgi:two-component system chemotaxis response regulator CheY